MPFDRGDIAARRLRGDGCRWVIWAAIDGLADLRAGGAAMAIIPLSAAVISSRYARSARSAHR